MGEQQIINILNLANHNQLELLQSKVEYLVNEANVLEEQKMKCTNDVEILNDRRDRYMREEYMHEAYLAQLREEISYQENQSRLGYQDYHIMLKCILGSVHTVVGNQPTLKCGQVTSI
jgi:hypothetical protein